MIPRPALHIAEQDRQIEKARQEIRAKFKIVFSDGMGRDVLSFILRDLGMDLDIDPSNIAANALRNYAIRLAEMAGKDIVNGVVASLKNEEA